MEILKEKQQHQVDTFLIYTDVHIYVHKHNTPVQFVSFMYLEVWFGHTYGDLLEQGLLDLFKVRRLNDIQDLFDFTQEHQLEVKSTICSKRPSEPARQTCVLVFSIPLFGCRFWARTSEALGSPVARGGEKRFFL